MKPELEASLRLLPSLRFKSLTAWAWNRFVHDPPNYQFFPVALSIMASPEEQAVAFKNEGNKAFAAHDWPTAIDLYTKAIDLNDKEPTYYSNRAQV